MSILKIVNIALDIASHVMTDDNGKTYREDDGSYIPNNDYDLDGIQYQTDDNGSIYSADGRYYPNDAFELDGTWYSTDDNGQVEG